MNSLHKLFREMHVYLKEEDLPLRGRAFGWVLVAIGAAVATWIFVDAFCKL